MYTSEIHKIFTRVFDNCYQQWYVSCVCIDVYYLLYSLRYGLRYGLRVVAWVWYDTTEFYSIYKYTWGNFRPMWDALSPNIRHTQANYKNS